MSDYAMNPRLATSISCGHCPARHAREPNAASILQSPHAARYIYIPSPFLKGEGRGGGYLKHSGGDAIITIRTAEDSRTVLATPIACGVRQ